MNGAQRRANKRLFDGRIEKRLPTSVPVYLASIQSGEGSLITLLTGGFPQVGRVIYCLPKVGDCFCLGVEFPDRTVKWDVHSSA